MMYYTAVWLSMQQKLASRIHSRKPLPHPNNSYKLRRLIFDCISNRIAVSGVLDEDFGKWTTEVVRADADSGRGGKKVDGVEDEDFVDVDGDEGEGFFDLQHTQLHVIITP